MTQQINDLNKDDTYKNSIIVTGILYIVTIISLAAMTESTLTAVFLGMFPTLLHALSVFLFLSKDVREENFWILPLVYSAALLGMWKLGINSRLSIMSGPALALVNIIVCYIINIFILKVFIKAEESDREPKKELVEMTSSEFEELIEDYSKQIKENEKKVEELNNELSGSLSYHQHQEILRKYKRQMEAEKEKLEELNKELKMNKSISRSDYTDLLNRYAEQKEFNKKEIIELWGQVKDIRNTDRKEYEQIIGKYAEENMLSKKQISELHSQIKKMQNEIAINKDNFTITLRSIEDKCKALNFAVGRVYADKRGANSNIRDKITIKREWYNKFSELTKEYKEENAPLLLEILYKINNQLEILLLPEKKVFTLKTEPRIPVKRNHSGKDPILLVLANNDKDPIMYYYEETKEITTKLIDYLQQ